MSKFRIWIHDFKRDLKRELSIWGAFRWLARLTVAVGILTYSGNYFWDRYYLPAIDAVYDMNNKALNVFERLRGLPITERVLVDSTYEPDDRALEWCSVVNLERNMDQAVQWEAEYQACLQKDLGTQKGCDVWGFQEFLDRKLESRQ